MYILFDALADDRPLCPVVCCAGKGLGSSCVISPVHSVAFGSGGAVGDGTNKLLVSQGVLVGWCPPTVVPSHTLSLMAQAGWLLRWQKIHSKPSQFPRVLC